MKTHIIILHRLVLKLYKINSSFPSHESEENHTIIKQIKMFLILEINLCVYTIMKT